MCMVYLKKYFQHFKYIESAFERESRVGDGERERYGGMGRGE